MRARNWFRLVWITSGLAFFGWLVRGFQTDTLPAEMYGATPGVEIERGESESRFTPKTNARGVGLVFFPGAMVSPMAYDPLARRVASEGFPVVVVHLPRWLVFGASATEKVMARAFTKTEKGRWAVGGHSRGGMLAGEFAYLYPERVAGLILIGTTHPRDRDLSRFVYPVTKIMGSEDGVAPVAQSRENARLLPPQTRMVTIDGANHAQFGYYRYQLFDGRAKIGREEQQRQLTRAVVAALEEMEKQRQ
ncbi:MAG: alpha/beta fold hydrolase [Acidobacteriota bacterium]